MKVSVTTSQAYHSRKCLFTSAAQGRLSAVSESLHFVPWPGNPTLHGGIFADADAVRAALFDDAPDYQAVHTVQMISHV